MKSTGRPRLRPGRETSDWAADCSKSVAVVAMPPTSAKRGAPRYSVRATQRAPSASQRTRITWGWGWGGQGWSGGCR